jgi:Uma2 family endonuclease
MRIEGPVPRRYDEDTGPDAAPAPAPYRFTREEYHRMGEAGLFEGKRVELLDGEIITMSPQSSAHAATVAHALHALREALPRELVIRGQHPIVLDDESEPEPDIVVCAPQPNEYYHAHPEASQVLFALEVAVSSLAYDRGRKAAAYARAAIPGYGVLDPGRRLLELLTDPDPAAARYEKVEVLGEDGRLPHPGGSTIRVADLLPPR